MADCLIRADDLGTLNDSTWKVVDVKAIRKLLKPVLTGMDDEFLMEAFYDTFINDFRIKKVASNTFVIDWDEYSSDYVSLPWKSASAPLKEGVRYTGEQVIKYMLNGYETPQHLSLLFNRVMYSYGKACFPLEGDRSKFILCIVSGTFSHHKWEYAK